VTTVTGEKATEPRSAEQEQEESRIWILVCSGLLSACASACLTCKIPDSHALSAHAILVRSAVFVSLSILASAAGVLIVGMALLQRFLVRLRMVGTWAEPIMSEFKWRQFEGEIILWAVRWYCGYGISYRDLEQIMGERGVLIDHSTIYRWVQRYAPEMEKRLRWHWRRPQSTRWRVDETYVKVRGERRRRPGRSMGNTKGRLWI